MVDQTFVRGDEIKIYSPLFPQIEDQEDITFVVPQDVYAIRYDYEGEELLHLSNVSIFLSHNEDAIVDFNIIDNPENFIVARLKIENTEDAPIVYTTLLELKEYDFIPNGVTAYAVVILKESGEDVVLETGSFEITEQEIVSE
jgi:hypothetical protein